MTKAPALSFVTTLYRSSVTLEDFIRQSVAAARQLVGTDFEIVLVDDGSPDDSLALAKQLSESVPQLVIVELSRNFGHHQALLEGMRQSRGDLVFLIDSDLEEDPRWLLDFADEMNHADADVVYGYQASRKGSVFERASGALYWGMFRSLTGLHLPSNIVTCRLMTRQYVEAVLEYRENQVSIGGIFTLAGFNQKPVPVGKRDKGSSTYSLPLKMWHLINSVTSFSSKPLELIFLIGLLTTLVGFLLIGYLVLAAVVWNQPPVGWTSVMASLWLIGGIIILSLGTIAIYLGKVFLEVKGRPRVLVKSKTNPRTAAMHSGEQE